MFHRKLNETQLETGAIVMHSLTHWVSETETVPSQNARDLALCRRADGDPTGLWQGVVSSQTPLNKARYAYGYAVTEDRHPSSFLWPVAWTESPLWAGFSGSDDHTPADLCPVATLVCGSTEQRKMVVSKMIAIHGSNSYVCKVCGERACLFFGRSVDTGWFIPEATKGSPLLRQNQHNGKHDGAALILALDAPRSVKFDISGGRESLSLATRAGLRLKYPQDRLYVEVTECEQLRQTYDWDPEGCNGGDVDGPRVRMYSGSYTVRFQRVYSPPEGDWEHARSLSLLTNHAPREPHFSQGTSQKKSTEDSSPPTPISRRALSSVLRDKLSAGADCGAACLHGQWEDAQGGAVCTMVELRDANNCQANAKAPYGHGPVFSDRDLRCPACDERASSESKCAYARELSCAVDRFNQIQAVRRLLRADADDCVSFRFELAELVRGTGAPPREKWRAQAKVVAANLNLSELGPEPEPEPEL